MIGCVLIVQNHVSGETDRDLLKQLMLKPRSFDARQASPGIEPPDSICKRRNAVLGLIL